MEKPLRILIFCLGLVPFAWLFYGAVANTLGPDPGEHLMVETGEWSLRFLVLTLLASPLRAWTGSSLPLKLRRMMGLYTFFYACVHFVLFLQFYLGWSIGALAEELLERPYVLAGFAAWLLMFPLALTSTRAMQRRLRAHWLKLHRLVYPAAIVATLHLLWQARSDIGEALIYAAIFAVLLGWRLRRSSSKSINSRPAIG